MKKIIHILLGLIMIVCLTACAKSLEQQIAEQLELGQKYLAEQNYEEAIVAFSKVIELEPKTIAAYTGLVQSYDRLDQLENLSGAVQSGLNILTDSPDLAGQEAGRDFLNMATVVFEAREDWENWIDVMELWAASEPENEENLLRLGQKYLELMEYEKAKDCFEKVLAINPENSEAYLGMIESCIQTSDYEQAATYVKEGYEQAENEQIQEKIAEYEKQLQEDKEQQKIQNKYGENLETLYGICQNGDDDGIWDFLFSSVCEELSYEIGREGEDKSIVYPIKNGKVIQIYVCDRTMTYLYYGDMENGVREGTGEWYECNKGTRTATGETILHYSKYTGEWHEDYPNGTGTYEEFDSESSGYKVTGTYFDGKEHGNMEHVWYLNDNTVRTFSYTADNGIARVIGTATDGGLETIEIAAYAQESSDSWLALDDEQGIQPFSGWGGYNANAYSWITE